MARNKDSDTKILLIEQIAKRILLIRRQKVILDADLAELYRTETKRLNEQVKRNIKRFPEDFCFQLSEVDRSHSSAYGAAVAERDQADRVCAVGG